MVKVTAHNESELAEEIFKSDIDLGVFFHAFCRKLGASASTPQAKGLMKEMDYRYSKKAMLEIWKDRGELHTLKDYDKEFVDAVREVYGIELSDLVKGMAEKRNCDTNLNSPFIRGFGEIYFNDAGANAILMELQMKKSSEDYQRLAKYIKL